jgi:hypothetical protein
MADFLFLYSGAAMFSVSLCFDDVLLNWVTYQHSFYFLSTIHNYPRFHSLSTRCGQKLPPDIARFNERLLLYHRYTTIPLDCPYT